jgi:hypothetical protein
MKKLALTLIVLLSLGVVAGFSLKLFSHEKVRTFRITRRQETMASPLSQSEESDLHKLLSQALLSMKTWDGRTDTGCPEVNEKQFNLTETIKEKEGQEIEIRLDVRENTLVVYLDQLRMYLVFPRLHDKGLAPPIDRQFCEKSYADSVATQKQYPYFERSKKTVRGDPGMTAIIDQINEKYPSPDDDKITREEVRTYRVPTLTAKAVEPYDDWNNEKKDLYKRILEIMQREACLSLSYSPNYPVTVTVPDFNLGDPDIHLLLTGHSRNSSSIEWIIFSRDVSNGKYTAEPAKNLGLADEIKPLIPLIKAKQAKQITVECRTK